MPGIIRPVGNAGGMPTAASVVQTLRGGPPGGAKNNIPDGIENLEPALRVKFLIGLGYDLNEKAGWGPKAKAAWKNMMSARKQDISPQTAAEFWSSHSSNSASFKAPAKAPAKAPVTTVKTAPEGTGAPVTTTVDPGTAFTAPLSKKAQAVLAAALGTRLPMAQQVDVPGLVKSLGPNYRDDLISSLAGQDSINKSIDYLKSLVDQNTRDTVQAGKNIDSWYTEVGNSLATASERDKAINAASLASIQDVSKGLASAIGGSAAPGAGQVAATGAQGAQLIGAMGNINEQYNADIAPLIQMEATGQKAQAQSEGASRAQALQGQIIDTQNQGAQQMADAQLKLAQLNHDLDAQRASTRLQGQSFNNDVVQQGFQNQLARGQSVLAAAGLGVDVAQLGAGINKAATDATVKGLTAAQRSADARAKARAKALAPPSASTLRESYKTAFQAVDALRQTGNLDVNRGIQAVKSAYGITERSNRATRQAAYNAARQALPQVRVDRRWFGLA